MEIVNPRALEWRPVRPVDGSDLPEISTSITVDEARELRRLAKDKRVVEIGTAYGFSAVAMARAGAEAVVTCDPHQWLNSLELARRAIRLWGVEDKVTLLVGRSVDMLHRFEDESFDFAFIDGDHGKFAVMRDVELASRLVRPGGYIAAHDYGEASCPGVAEALQFIWPDGPCRLVDTLYIRRMA